MACAICLAKPTEFIGEDVREIEPNPRHKILCLGRGVVTSRDAEISKATVIYSVVPLLALSPLEVGSVEIAQP